MVKLSGSSREMRGMFLAVLAAAALGTEGIAAKLAYAGGANIQTVLALRFLMAAVFFWGNLLLSPSIRKIDTTTFYRLVVLSTGGQGVTVLLLFYSFCLIPAAAAILLFYLYPAVVAILAAIFLQESLTRSTFGALAITFLGLIIILGVPAGGWNTGGVVAALLAAVTNGIYMVGQAYMLKCLDHRTFNSYMTLIVGVVFLAVALMTGDFDLSFNIQALLAITALALITTVLAFTAMAKGLQYIGAQRVAIICTLEPAITAVLANLVLGEKLLPAQALGGVLIILGVTWQQLARQGSASRNRS
ncbi:Drug/metabolite transporter [Moorella glycerini]|uniref:EamA-like transporter family protein n=1 Tax=Neomoorella stamsii TaxID=1266720 RepID=A0A9X7J2D3_9FIRM|nr:MULTISPECIES: DMT family transporter [Moorella]PRR72168.1 EamA-like transporter family protein [Moorella stamsii]CEP69469.1 Drug/metabolite transporter [Moorella glycerini]